MRFAAPDAFDFALGVAERDELLEELRVAVLDVVDADHHVVAHLEGEIELLNSSRAAAFGGFVGIERGDVVADGRAVDLHEDEAEAAGDVLHQGRLAVAGRRDEEQEAACGRCAWCPPVPICLARLSPTSGR